MTPPRRVHAGGTGPAGAVLGAGDRFDRAGAELPAAEARWPARAERRKPLRERPDTAFGFLIEEHSLPRGTGGPEVTRELIDSYAARARPLPPRPDSGAGRSRVPESRMTDIHRSLSNSAPSRARRRAGATSRVGVKRRSVKKWPATRPGRPGSQGSDADGSGPPSALRRRSARWRWPAGAREGAGFGGRSPRVSPRCRIPPTGFRDGQDGVTAGPRIAESSASRVFLRSVD
ncbi:Scr1 family TA system antitoxin-like transcriptional regulator [Streptomyces sp. CAU 1734]|uniref:Scr1 family TA system antitoxin-like transcriptional regulator n=1 Tax=Streptomyces sp. CAU 1734 TaxID=3140360 RepID=UPI003261595B